MMKFSLRDIPSTGLHVQREVPSVEIGITKEDLDLRSPLSIDVTITRVDNMVLADAFVTVSYGYQCARCLEDFERPKTREFHFNYEIETPTDIIDVGEDIRQELILGVSQRILCKKDCKGICLGCRVNLNIEKCKCKK